MTYNISIIAIIFIGASDDNSFIRVSFGDAVLLDEIAIFATCSIFLAAK